MIVIRAQDNLSSEKLRFYAQELIERCHYKQGAPLNEAPNKADCLSALYYLINKAAQKPLEIPIYWIGNAPQRLVKRWSFKIIDTQEYQDGDLIFVRLKDKKDRLVTHAIMVIEEKFFHCSSRAKGAEWLSFQEIEKIYEQPFTCDELLENLDPRSNSYLESKLQIHNH